MIPATMKSIYDFEDVKCFKPNHTPVFWVEMTGISNCDGRYYISREDSDVLVCEYIIRGKGTLHVDGNTYYPASGDIYMIPLHSNHEYFSDDKDPWVKIFFNVYGTGIPSMLKAFGVTNRILFSDCEHLHPLFEEIYKKTHEELPVETIMEDCCGLFVKFLMRLQYKMEKPADNSEEAQAVKNFIEHNIHRELTMKEIANSIFRSPDYVNKLFKHYYGTTPYAYYNELRISNAEALLLHTTLSIKEIAERLGYKSAHYFSKQFHHIKGVTASDFRRAEKNT